ncbi:hypothetical protein FACS1894191_1810 [Clostridia bacterium]|nr:hypothetical protein FACS1894191_1810 [Clostridia bacterium]
MKHEHEVVVCGVPFGKPEEKEALKIVKEHGFTSVQIYVFWRHIEPEKRGEFVWEYYDRQVKLIQEAGLKWVPFLIFGPPYGFPDWWLEDERHVGLKCVEHQKENRVESIWNPHWPGEVSRLLEAFAAHYMPWNVIESIQPGICGDYGEAIFPAVGNWPGMYHTHRGYWCLDDYALSSFRGSLTAQYKDIAALNTAWRSNYKAFDDIVPFLRHKSPSRTAYYDLLMWYKQSMTDYDEYWMKECARVFPKIPVYMCTGGNEEPWLGADFAHQSKASAKYGGGIRLTNETNVFSENYYKTAHTVSACKYYGAYMGLEPVGSMIPRGVTARIFGSAAYGNRQIFHYYSNLVSEEHGQEGAKRALQYDDLVYERELDSKVAFFWPLDQAWLESAPVSSDIAIAMNYVRRQYEVWTLGESLILDGALDKVNVLVMIGASFTRREVLEKIAQWVHDGGVLLTDLRTTDIEGDYVPAYDDALGFKKDSECCTDHTVYYPNLQPWSKLFNSEDTFRNGTSWMDLAPDIISISNSKPRKSEPGDNYQTETKSVSSCFEHKYGKGRSIYYGGPLDLNPTQDQIAGVTHAYEHILADVCQAFSGIEQLGTKPDEIARARYEGGLLVLKTDEITQLK